MSSYGGLHALILAIFLNIPIPVVTEYTLPDEGLVIVI